MPTAFFTDNFNSYPNGDLVGQGGWANGYGTGKGTVGSTQIIEGKSALTPSDTILTIGPLSTLEDGCLYWYARPSQTTHDWPFAFGNNVYPAGNRVFDVTFNSSGKITFNGIENMDLGSYGADTWYFIRVEWAWTSETDNQARVSINNGAWSGWQAGTIGRKPNTVVSLWIGDGGAGVGYMDYFGNSEYINNGKIKIGDAWKDVSSIQINVGDSWKTIF